MPFTSMPLNFGLDFTETIRSIKREIFGESIPPIFYHYTGLKGVLGIGGSCSFHAISTEDLADKTEIQHGVAIVQEEIQHALNRPGSRFAQWLLESLPDSLSARKAWTFTTCFCLELGSAFHCFKYGGYCLQVDTLSAPDPRLRPQGLLADVQYQRVLYVESEKRAAVRHAVDAIIACAGKSSRVNLQGPWAESIGRSHSRIAAQCLMDIVASLKSPEYAKDREWRIVCHPRFSIAASAPDLDDDAFRCLIKTRDDKKRYVELSILEQGQTFGSFPETVLPFSAIYVANDFREGSQEHSAILKMLERSGRPDIPLVPFP